MKKSDTSSFAMYESVNVASKPEQNNVVANSNAILSFRYIPIVFVQLLKQTKRNVAGPSGRAVYGVGLRPLAC
jgi:hypothetical protein